MIIAGNSNVSCFRQQGLVTSATEEPVEVYWVGALKIEHFFNGHPAGNKVRELFQSDPGLKLLSIGVHDIYELFKSVAEQRFAEELALVEERYQSIFREFCSLGGFGWLIFPQPIHLVSYAELAAKDLFQITRVFNKKIEDYCHEQGILVINPLNRLLGSDGNPLRKFLQQDGIHLNPEGTKLYLDDISNGTGTILSFQPELNCFEPRNEVESFCTLIFDNLKIPFEERLSSTAFQKKLTDFVTQLLEQRGIQFEVNVVTELVDSGLMDSLSLVETYDFAVNLLRMDIPFDVNLRELDTIEKLSEFLLVQKQLQDGNYLHAVLTQSDFLVSLRSDSDDATATENTLLADQRIAEMDDQLLEQFWGNIVIVGSGQQCPYGIILYWIALNRAHRGDYTTALEFLAQACSSERTFPFVSPRSSYYKSLWEPLVMESNNQGKPLSARIDNILKELSASPPKFGGQSIQEKPSLDPKHLPHGEVFQNKYNHTGQSVLTTGAGISNDSTTQGEQLEHEPKLPLLWEVGRKVSSEDDLLQELAKLPICSSIHSLYIIGAHLFQERELIDRLFPNLSHIYLFEPIPELSQYLSDFTANDSRIRVFPYAIADQNGGTRFNVTSNQASSSLLHLGKHREIFPHVTEIGSIPVECRTLETVIREFSLVMPDMLFIDVQGAEYQVLSALSASIRSFVKLIYTEASTEDLYIGSRPLKDVTALLDRDFAFLGFAPLANNTPTHGNALFVNWQEAQLLWTEWGKMANFNSVPINKTYVDNQKEFLNISPLYEPLSFDLGDNSEKSPLESCLKRDEPSRQLKVTALVSTYNSEFFLKGCLEDLTEQSLFKKGELEIIVIDSGSEQREKAIVEEFQRDHQHIRYIKTERETLYAAWNRGIWAASGDYITNANTDDRHRPDALEVMCRALDDNPEIDLVYGDCYVSTIPNESFAENNKGRIYRYPTFSPPESLLYYQFGPQPMWRKSVHAKIGFFDDRFKAAGDYDFNIRFALQCQAQHLPQILGLYLAHENALSFKDNTAVLENAKIKDEYRTYALIEALYQQAGILANTAEEKARIHLLMGFHALEFYPPWYCGKPESDIEFAVLCVQKAASLSPVWPPPWDSQTVSPVADHVPSARSIFMDILVKLPPSLKMSLLQNVYHDHHGNLQEFCNGVGPAPAANDENRRSEADTIVGRSLDIMTSDEVVSSLSVMLQQLQPEELHKFYDALAPLVANMAKTGIGTDACLAQGCLPLPIHYYSPVPDINDLKERGIYSKISDLKGIEWCAEKQADLLLNLGRSFGFECNWSPHPTGNPDVFYSENNSFSFGCAAALHCMLRFSNPKRVFEIGSGFSSKVINGALALNRRDHGGDCDYTIIDPYPDDAKIRRLGSLTRILRQRVETVPIPIFSDLRDGDVLFIDSGHVVKAGGDVNFLILDVLPMLARGVIIHFHDIPMPREYPEIYHTNPSFRVFWTESYLLQAFLAFNNEFEVLLSMLDIMESQKEVMKQAFPHFDPTQHLLISCSLWLIRK